MSDKLITFANISRFYGEVLGVNKVSLTIPPGVTSLVGPNGSGKTTLMNLMTGLIRPSQGEIDVLGISTEDPTRLCRAVGYCAQFDTYPKGLTGYQFIYSFLRVFGWSHEECDRRTMAALEIVGLVEARNRPVAAYSKGMRQRAKLAQSTAHDPQVMVLDEPLNGLDPLARAEAIALFEKVGQGRPPRHRLQPHPPRGGPHQRPGHPAQPGLRGRRRPDPERPRRSQGSAHADPGALRPSQ